MVITVNRPNAKNRFIEAYKNSSMYDLFDCYTKPSKQKRNEFYRCIEEQNADNGYNGKILSYNTFLFTYGYKVIIKNELYLKVFTKNNIYLIKIGD